MRLNQDIFRASQKSDKFWSPSPPLLVGLKMRFLGYSGLEELINFVKIDSRSVMCFLLIVGVSLYDCDFSLYGQASGGP